MRRPLKGMLILYKYFFLSLNSSICTFMSLIFVHCTLKWGREEVKLEI